VTLGKCVAVLTAATANWGGALIAQTRKSEQRANICTFPARSTKKNFHAPHVKTDSVAIRDLDAKLEIILCEQVLRSKAVWGARGIL
jgi:hypothetical protein